MAGSAFRGIATLLSAVLAGPLPALAQGAPSIPPAPVAASVPAAEPAAELYNMAQLDALLAPIALYPDTLLTQIMMASTLPVQVLQARLWLDNPANKALTGNALAKALETQSWDPSVKSLAPFPQVVTMMTDKTDWMQQLGYAVSVQQADVLDSVQRLRRQAQQAGSLTTTAQQKVTAAPPARPGAPQVIIVEPADPLIVYVPSYNPTQVYGAWPYPATPPVYLPPPPGYAIGSALVTGMAFAAGAAVVGSLWNVGRPNWGGGNVNINVNQWNNVNVNRPPVQNGNWRPPNAGGNYGRPPGGPGGGGQGGRPIRPPGGPVGMPNRGNGLPVNAIGRPSVSVPGGAVNRPHRAPGGGPGSGGVGANRPNPPGGGAGRPGMPNPGAGVNRPNLPGAGRPARGNNGGGNIARPNPGAGIERPAARPARSPEAFGGMGEGRQAPAFANRGAQSRNIAAAGNRAPHAAGQNRNLGGGGGGGGRGGHGGGRRH